MTLFPILTFCTRNTVDLILYLFNNLGTRFKGDQCSFCDIIPCHSHSQLQWPPLAPLNISALSNTYRSCKLISLRSSYNSLIYHNLSLDMFAKFFHTVLYTNWIYNQLLNLMLHCSILFFIQRVSFNDLVKIVHVFIFIVKMV